VFCDFPILARNGSLLALFGYIKKPWPEKSLVLFFSSIRVMLSKTNWPYNAVLRAAATTWEESHMRKETISLSSDTDHQTQSLSFSR
jgi:hypothetical protein